jgi:L-tartrate/succinate antiporter
LISPAANKGPSIPGLLVPLAIGAAIALAPVPSGLPSNAWYYFALFTAIIVAMIAEPLPGAVLGLTGVILAAVLGLVRPTAAEATSWALSGFANSTVWLIFAAYMFALGYLQTGLGRRIALHLIRLMGHRTLGLGYAISLADLAIAPFTASATARTGGTIYPIIRNIPELYGSRPEDGTSRRIGAYIMYTALAASMVTSSMFITALAPNALAISVIAKMTNVNIPWVTWFTGFAPVGVTLLVSVPLLIYVIYPPEIKRAPEAPRWAADKLRDMGPISRREMTLLVLVMAALGLWIGATHFIEPALVAVLVVVLMVALRVLSWDEVIGNSQAWNVLIWFATLVTLATGLTETKFVDWIGRSIAPALSGLGTYTTIVGLVGAFFFLHYFFASITAHTTALLPVFLGVAVDIPGVSTMAWSLLLAYPLGLLGILTTYSSGQTALYYGSGFFTRREFWVLGLVCGVFFFVVYITIIVPWLSFLGI